ncbi:hypothetical protein Tco_1503132 [Tanacetum coccineum]
MAWVGRNADIKDDVLFGGVTTTISTYSIIITTSPDTITTTTVPSPPLPASPTHPLGYRAAMIQLRAESPSTSYPLLLPPPIILSHTRAPMAMMRAAAPSTCSDRPGVCLQPRKRLCTALGPRYEIEESSSAPTARPTGGFRADYGFVANLDDEIRRDPERDVGYGIIDTWDEMLEGMPGAPATDETELGQRLTDFATMVRQDTYEIYGRLDEAHDARAVLSGWLNLLRRDRRAHAHPALLMEREARLSHEAWRLSMDARDAARSEVMALRTTVTDRDCKVAGCRPQATETSHRGIDTDEDTADIGDRTPESTGTR